MKLNRILTCITAIAFVLTAQTAMAADVAKIGIVNSQRVLMTSKAGKQAQAKISATGKKMETELKKKGKEIEYLKSRRPREARVLSKAGRDTREREVRIKINDLKSTQLKYRQQLQGMEKQLLGKLRQDILKVANEIGKKEGFLLIIDRLGVLYAPKSLDITDKLIKAFNKTYSGGTTGKTTGKKTGKKKQ